MRFGRTLPPAAAPIYFRDLIAGFRGHIRGAREIEGLERDLKGFFGVRYCFTVSSGKTALFVILRALKALHEERDEVLIPAYTCYSVPSAIVRAGLRVRLCDVDPGSLDFDFDQLSRALPLERVQGHAGRESLHPKNEELGRANHGHSRLLAVLGIHLFGLPADIEKLRELIGDPYVTIVEDAAQAMGGYWKGQKLGTLGDVGFFSLGRGKALSAVEGGVILTNREDIAEEIMNAVKILPGLSVMALISIMVKAVAMIIFLRPGLFWLPKSLPFLRLGETIYDPNFRMNRMSMFQAGLAKGWKEKLAKLRHVRAENAASWASSPIDHRFFHYALVNGKRQNLVRYPIRVRNGELRQWMLTESEKRGLGIMPGYPDSIDGIGELGSHLPHPGFPLAKRISREIITLPVHSFVSSRDKEEILSLLQGRRDPSATAPSG
jgi:perosamine synthetase